MWKKGELVWANLKYPETWLPGRVIDPSERFGVLVSFFDLMEPRYFPAVVLRRFERDFETLVSDSPRLRRFLNRALGAYFWNISYGIWCSCQPPIVSPYFDRENSLPSFSLSSDSALGFVRNVAISLWLPPDDLAEANCWSAQILSFRRYAVDFERSKAVYQESKESANLTDQPEALDSSPDSSDNMECLAVDPMFLETASSDMGNNEVLSGRDPLFKDIPCCSSPEQPVEDDEVQNSGTPNPGNPLADSNTSMFLKACKTMVWSVKQEDDYQAKSGNCMLNAEAAIEEIMDEDTITTDIYKDHYTNSTGPLTAESEAAPDHMIETPEKIINSSDENVTSAEQLSHMLDMRKNKACLAEPSPCVVLKAYKTLACSVNEADGCHPGKSSARSNLANCRVNAEAVIEGTADRNTVIETRENCPVDSLEPLSAEAGKVPIHVIETPNEVVNSNDGGIAPAEQLSHLDATITDENQMRDNDNAKSVKIKRKASVNAASRNSFKKKKVAQQSASVYKPLNPPSQVAEKVKAACSVDSRCLRLKFLRTHDLPSKGELMRKFSAFGKIDPSRTDVYPHRRCAKVVFTQSIDAVAAYECAKRKKVSFGQSKVLYRLNSFRQNNVGNKVSTSQKPQEPTSTLKSCLKKPNAVDKEPEGRNLKVRFRQVAIHVIGTPNEGVNSNDGGVAPAEQLSHLDGTTAHENQMSDGDNAKSIKIKGKASVNGNAASGNSIKKNKVARQSASVDEPLNPLSQVAEKVKAAYSVDSRCLRMKFLRSRDLPSKGDLIRKFSAFGKIDTSRTEVYPHRRSAKIVFTHSIDAVAAYECAKSKKASFGQSKVLYRLDPCGQNNEGNEISMSQKPQEPTPTLKSCLKKPNSVDKEGKEEIPR